MITPYSKEFTETLIRRLTSMTKEIEELREHIKKIEELLDRLEKYVD